MDSTTDPVSAQLRATLHDSIRSALNTHRPLLTHLNADTTWLLSLPCPPNSPNPPPKSHYHILIDPWLRGPQSDIAPLFSQQRHAHPSAVQSISAVEDVIKNIEQCARAQDIPCDTAYIDAVVVSHEFTDHMHKETLLEVPATVPVFATARAAGMIASWGHFERVREIEGFAGDWREGSGGGLPRWVGVSRVAGVGVGVLYYHSAVMIAFSMAGEEEGGAAAEALIYTPHGIEAGDLAMVGDARPPIRTLALLHGLQDVSLPRAQLNKGAHNGLKVQRLLKAKYWVGTHDEVKVGGGIVSWFLNRKAVTLREALEREARENGKSGDVEKVGDIEFLDVGNGESLILA